MTETWLDRLLKFLRENIPMFLAGYKLGQSNKNDLKKENTNLKLQLERQENEKTIREHNSNLTDDELKSEILGGRTGRRTDSTD